MGPPTYASLSHSCHLSKHKTASHWRRTTAILPLTRNDVIVLQEVLARLGYYVGPIDGVVGRQTAEAAKALAGTLERDFVRRPSGQEIVLDCKIEGAPRGWDSTQIMIDEHRDIIIYGFQLPANRGSYNPIHRVGKGSGTGYIDLSMKITMNNDNFIMANDTSGALVINKHDGRFVKSFVTLIPVTIGSWFAEATRLRESAPKAPSNDAARAPKLTRRGKGVWWKRWKKVSETFPATSLTCQDADTKSLAGTKSLARRARPLPTAPRASWPHAQRGLRQYRVRV